MPQAPDPTAPKATACKNCATPVEGNFCSSCGQDRATERLTLGAFLAYVTGVLWNFERPFWRTTSGMLRRPGVTISEYVDGRRVTYSNPFRFVIIAGIATFALQSLLFDPPQQPAAYAGWPAWQQENWHIGLWFHTNQQLLLPALLPILAGLLRLFFLRSGRNYAEQLAFVFFCYGMIYLGQAALMPLVYFVPTAALAPQPIPFVVVCWAAIRFNNLRALVGIPLSLIAHLLFWTVIQLLMLGVAIYLAKLG